MAVKVRKDFLDSEEGRDIRRILQSMSEDSSYNTDSSYSANTSQHPDNLISFADKHMNYLSTHPNLKASQYVANIKLMARIRR
jgi:hypothetical protein